MKLEELSVEQLEEEKRIINMKLARRHRTYLLEQNGKRTAEIIKSLKELWGENWSITMDLVSADSDLYPKDVIEKSNDLMLDLRGLRAERRNIYKKLLKEEE